MRSRHPLQRFLDHHDLSQSRFAAAVDVSRETVNRWIHRRNLPYGHNLLRVLRFARRFEPGIDVGYLFPPLRPAPNGRPPLPAEDWGEACVLCEVAWNAATEHLPLALLDPDVGDHPLGDLCESCAARVMADDSDEVAPDDGKTELESES